MNLPDSSVKNGLIKKHIYQHENFIILRSVHKSVASLPWPADRKKENGCKEKHSKSRIQRTVRILHSNGEAKRLYTRNYRNGQRPNRPKRVYWQGNS